MSETQTTESSKPQGGIVTSLRQAWLILLLALLYGTGLAGIQIWLKPYIEANKARKTLTAVPELFGEYTDPADAEVGDIDDVEVNGRPGSKISSGAGEFLAHGVTIKNDKDQDVKIIKVFNSDRQHIGWLIPAAGQGYGDVIELLVGVDAQVDTVKGIYILAQKETPGLGNKIVKRKFRKNYQDAPTDRQLIVVKREKQAPHEISAISGATVSSENTTAIVNNAIAVFKEALRQQNQE